MLQSKSSLPVGEQHKLQHGQCQFLLVKVSSMLTPAPLTDWQRLQARCYSASVCCVLRPLEVLRPLVEFNQKLPYLEIIQSIHVNDESWVK